MLRADLPADDHTPINERGTLALGTKVGCWFTGSFSDPSSHGWVGPFTIIANDTTNGIIVCNDDRAGCHEFATFDEGDDLILWPTN